MDPDIISNLPSNMVDNILIRLPIRDAARTSILSKKWRFNWHYISEVVFDTINFRRNRSTESLNQLCLEIYRVLLLHHGPLRKFVLLLRHDHVSEVEISLIDHIMICLTRKDIHELTLYSHFKPYKMTSTLFQCEKLTHLNVSGCLFRLPPEFTGFKLLTSVELTEVCLNANDFQTLIAKCPLLERIKLEFILEDDHLLEIDAPNLKFLDFCCNSISRSNLLKNVPLLSTINIRFRSTLPAPGGNIVQLFRSLPVIESFCASHSFLVDYYGRDIPERLPTMLNKLKSVELSEMSFNFLKDIQCVLLLLRSSPNLKKLKIQAYSRVFHSMNGDGTPISQMLRLVEDSFNQLGEVEMDFFGATEPELEFLKLLLAKSPVLNNVTLRPRNEIAYKNVPGVVKLVTGFQRASSAAEIVFNDCD